LTRKYDVLKITNISRDGYRAAGFRFFFFGLGAQLLRTYTQNIVTLPLYDIMNVHGEKYCYVD
jgi:hypothetical protein